MKKILFFTSYPRKGQIHDKKIVGGASYTKTLLNHLTRVANNLYITVYAERFDRYHVIPNWFRDPKKMLKRVQHDKNTYIENDIKVKRIWRRNNPFSVISSVIQAALEKVDTVVVSYEVNMVGGPIINILFLLSLLLVKIARKELIFVPHQVVEDFSHIEEHKLKAKLLNLMKSMLFGYISMISDKIIVFEEHLKNALPDPKKAVAIPIAVEELQMPGKAAARKKLGLPKDEFTILFFGFLSPYKGVEDVLSSYDRTDGLLILAGDGNPNHMNKQWYREYIHEVKMKAQEKGALVTGFVPEEDIKYYYAAADVLVLPYRIFFSSSFPLSLAASYERPVLISRKLEGYFKSQDFQKALKSTFLKKEDIVIDFKKELKTALRNIQKKTPQYTDFAKEIKRLRSWDKITKQFKEILQI